MKYFPELELVNEDPILVCKVCLPEYENPSNSGSSLPAGMFFIPAKTEEDEEIMSRAFRNFKISIAHHLKRDNHQEAISNDRSLHEWHEKEVWRNNKIAMHIGSACYRLYYCGQPYTDLEDELFLLYRCEVDIGDINHSHNFAHKYLNSLAEVVKGNIQSFLNTRLPHTGFLPPVTVLADKATFKRRTRQFVGVTTVIPDADDLIQYIYLGSPIAKHHDGEGVGKSIITALKEFHITTEQFSGG